jgi:hypothetical protein
MARKPKSEKSVDALRHTDAKRKNIPTAEHQSVLEKAQQARKTVRYPRNTDLDPQLVWRGKDEQDWSDLVVHAPPLYIQEKVHPKALIDDLLRQTKESQHEAGQLTADLFADFNGIPKGADKTEFYAHDQNWSNRMILGDSLQVMASLAEREGLRGRVQCIYFDPPYGIKFNSNFQWSTTSRDVKDGKADHNESCRWKDRPNHPRARAGQSLPRHLARRHPQLPHLPAGSAHRRPRSPHRFRLHLRADRRGKPSSSSCRARRGLWRRELRLCDNVLQIW